ncbi:ABC transporter substrate-binding protein [Bacteroides sp. OttesenSCG-928-D19]|nr:ABC transporter substrate-binding protein [Bacteroides sp. OttesenSCG-928-D19]
MPKGTVVRVPLRNMVVYTSVHSAVLDVLGATGDIVGVCESRYIKVPAVKEGLGNGSIQDLGEATSPNVERMIEIGAEVVLASPFDHGSYGPVEKLGIPIIECADYMETDPLGRAEWIKFIGLLTGRTLQAESFFRETESNYLRVKALVENVESRPKLMTGMKFGSAWYVPAGESFMARVYKDAGADYLFSYLPGSGGTPMSFETVLDKAIHADIWVMHYNREEDMTYDALKSDYSPYSQFDPFRNRRIYGCNTNHSLYYEEVPIRPDYLLTELIAIFHPQLVPDYTFRYFTPLK